jgi:hypothetical protein
VQPQLQDVEQSKEIAYNLKKLFKIDFSHEGLDPDGMPMAALGYWDLLRARAAAVAA